MVRLTEFVNLHALPIRLCMTCMTRPVSPTMHGRVEGMLLIRRTSLRACRYKARQDLGFGACLPNLTTGYFHGHAHQRP